MLLIKSPVFTMGLKNLTQTRETTARSVKVEGDEDSFFFIFYFFLFFFMEELFTMNSRLVAIMSTNNAILK